MVKLMNVRLWTLSLIGLLLAACVPVQAAGLAPTPEVVTAPAGEMAPIDHVAVEIGVGSPIPVHVVIDSSFPDSCAQLVAVQQTHTGSEFHLTVTTTAADEACASPMGPLPFRFDLPLNAAGLVPGTYTVTVNGVSTTFDYLTTP